MADRYDELMARREALMDEVYRRLPDPRSGPAPLTVMKFHAHGPILDADGKLSVSIDETDALGRKRSYTLRQELNGRVREMPPEPLEGSALVPFVKGRLRRGPRRDAAKLTELAKRHLGESAGAAWARFLRPAVRLIHADEDARVVAQLGGLPVLPINSWPVWEGHGPLSHILSLDCGALTEIMPSLQLPASGRLSFFFFDGQYDDHETFLDGRDPSKRPGARVIWFDPRNAPDPTLMDAATPAPSGLEPIWAAHDLPEERPGVASPAVEHFYDTLDPRPLESRRHQVGGHAFPMQSRVEADLAVMSLRASGVTGIDYTSPGIRERAKEWQLLAQIDTDDDAGMDWGGQRLYFLIREEDLNARRFDRAHFATQR